ncbi:MAG: hypothetical protein DLM59_14900 [Pseudonocardiales bacterium]|nr:MAG: hypothetical protein DLM59_14900 [Pseudonocardiales bacterium]
MSRARVPRSVLTLVVALIALSACGLPVHQRTVQAPQAGPALTLDAAKRVLATYEAGNNTANARRSAVLLARYETDTMLALDIASYRIQARFAPTKKYVPFYYTAPKFYVFSKRSAAEPWLVTLAPDPARGAKLPASLKGFAAAKFAYYTPAGQRVYALRTTDGGALAFYAVEGSVVATVLPGSLATLNPLGDDLALIGPGNYNVLSQISDLQFTVAIPRAGKVRVLGHNTGLASAHGE